MILELFAWRYTSVAAQTDHFAANAFVSGFGYDFQKFTADVILFSEVQC